MMTIAANDLTTPTNGLQWILDVSSGNNRSPNSKLIVGPVGEDDDQSTYYCSIQISGESRRDSSMEILTVIGKTNVDEK